MISSSAYTRARNLCMKILPQPTAESQPVSKKTFAGMTDGEVNEEITEEFCGKYLFSDYTAICELLSAESVRV